MKLNQYRKRFSLSWKKMHPGLSSGVRSLYEWMLAVCPMWVVWHKHRPRETAAQTRPASKVLV